MQRNMKHTKCYYTIQYFFLSIDNCVVLKKLLLLTMSWLSSDTKLLPENGERFLTMHFIYRLIYFIRPNY